MHEVIPFPHFDPSVWLMVSLRRDRLTRHAGWRIAEPDVTVSFHRLGNYDVKSPQKWT